MRQRLTNGVGGHLFATTAFVSLNKLQDITMKCKCGNKLVKSHHRDPIGDGRYFVEYWCDNCKKMVFKKVK